MYEIIESGKRIRELREKKNLTQEQLADELGVSYKTVNAIENGTRGTTVDTLDLIAESLDSSLDYIVRGVVGNNDIVKMIENVPMEKQELAKRLIKGILENL